MDSHQLNRPQSQVEKLPLEILQRILNCGDWSTVYALGSTCKSIHNSVKSCNLNLKTIYVNGNSKVTVLQQETSNVVVVRSTSFEYSLLRSFCKSIKKLKALEICSVLISRASLMGVLRIANLDCKNIKNINVPSEDFPRWRMQNKKHKDSTVTFTRITNVKYYHEIAKLANPLLANVSFEAVCNESRKHWVVDNTNMTEKLEAIRRASILKLKKKHKLNSPVEALSLNYIIVISPEYHLDYSVDLAQWEKVVKTCKEIYLKKEESVKKDEWRMIKDSIEEFSSCCNSSISSIQESIDETKVSAKYKENSNYKRTINMCSNIIQYISHNWDTKNLSENIFINQIIDPIVVAFLDKEIPAIMYKGSDSELQESKERKIEQARVNNHDTANIKGRLPDKSAYVTSSNSNNHHIFLCEVKTESYSNKRPDLVKLGSIVKDCIDNAIKKRNRNYFIVGLLVEGRTATLYSASLPSEGVYALVAMDTFFIPTSSKDMNTLVSTSRGMINCRALVVKAASIISNDDTKEEPNLEMIRKSCSSPSHHAEIYM